MSMEGGRRGKSRILDSVSLAAVLSSAFWSCATPVLAQEGQEEIVVTAQRREQALQDVPLAVSAYNAEALDANNITSTADLQRLAPSLLVNSSNSETGGSTIRIRGVGTTGNNIGLEGAVGVFIDGVYRQRAGLALNNLFDLARVEVLRGPQGTLFGKNTSAGAISVIPNAPHMGALEAAFEVGGGNYGDLEFQGMFNMPISETLAIRIAGAGQERDGYLEDPRTGQESYDRGRALVRIQSLWEPTNDLSWRLTFDGAMKDESCCQAPYRVVAGSAQLNMLLGGVAVPPLGVQPFTYTFFNTPGVPTPESTGDWGISSHLDYDLGFADLRTILAHREFDSKNSLDADFGPADILRQSFPAEQELSSAEIQLTGEIGRLDWLVGAYYADETIDQTVSTTYGTQTGAFVSLLTGGLLPPASGCPPLGLGACYPFGGGNISNQFFQEATSWSVFTHNTFNFTDQFSATLGLRMNNEEKEGGGRNFIVNSPSCAATPADHITWLFAFSAGLRTLCPRPNYTSSLSEEELTGIASLNWSPTDDVMLYASYSRGYKAGGINLDRDAMIRPGGPVTPTGVVVGTQAQINAAALFLPEFSDSYEVGLRTQWFDRSLTVNLTGFMTDYTDFQLNTFTGLGFIITNPGSVESQGVELETRWTPTPHFSANLSTTWVEARYGNDPALLIDPAGPPPALAGQQLTNAPDWTATGGIHYEHPFMSSGNVLAFVDLNAQYRSDYNTGSDLDPRKFQDAYTTLGARLGLMGQDSHGGWDAYLWGTNLTDEEIHVISFNSVFQAGSISTFPAAPAMYGITLRRTFN